MRIRLCFYFLLSFLLLLVLGSCSSSTGPGNGQDIQYVFQPSQTDVQAMAGNTIEFSVSEAGGAEFAANWRTGGVVLSQEHDFTFHANSVGEHTVNVDLDHNGEQASHQWTVTVSEDDSTIPPAVGNVVVVDGQVPGSVQISWTAVSGSSYPISDYVIGCSFSGPLKTDNWAEADVLITEPANAEIGYTRELTPEDGLIPGSRAWFGVRARDDHGQLSSLPTSTQWLLSYPWTLVGHIQDDHGQALGSAILRLSGVNAPVISGPDGGFSAGPFSSVDSVQVIAQALDPKFYIYTTPFLKVDLADSSLTITMIEKYGADTSCSANNGDFMAYLRYMTMTDGTSSGNVIRKWNRYPVGVYVPAFTRADNVDFQAIALSAMAYWNTALGEDVFQSVADVESADVIFEFPILANNDHGRVVMVDPPVSLGTASPVQMRVDIDRELIGQNGADTVLGIKGVCLHEFGHVMGFYRHSSCTEYHLMNDGNGAFAFSDTVSTPPITEDESHAAVCLRHLPDGVDMSGYHQ